MSALTDALDYIQRGWYPVPIPFRRKGPVLSGWQNLRLTAQDAPAYFNQQPLNIGVLLGVSSGLADVDLDCPEAIAVAPWFLPADTSRFGRASAPGSHWLFVSNIQADRSSIEFTDPCRINPSGQPEMIVELRVGGDRHAAQSVFPHSTHPDGEAIEWEQPHHDPQTLAEEQLKAAVRKIACAALLVRYWPSKGGRHSTSLALGGFLRRLGWDVSAIKTFVDAVVRNAGDPRPGQRVRDAEDAAGKVDRNERVYGLPKLTERLGRDIADTLAKWLGYAAASSAAAGTKPVIRLSADMNAVTEAAEQAIIAARLPIWKRDKKLVRPVIGTAIDPTGTETRTGELLEITAPMLRLFMGQAARFERFDVRARDWVEAKPPAEIAETILHHSGYWPFRPIRGVLLAPSMRPDGSLILDGGYDAATQLYLIDPPIMPAIPAAPTKADAEKALSLFTDMLEEFPFVAGSADEAVALSAMISPVLRAALGRVPLHGFTAADAGSGKSYLTNCCAAIATGFTCPTITAGGDDRELEKRLSAALLIGNPLVAIGNVERPMKGDFLCEVLDNPGTVKIRLLGRSEMADIEPFVILYVNGNNLMLVGDIVRRTLTCNLNANLEDPWTRDFQKRPLDLILADRGKYIAAALTICRAWLLSGEPSLKPLASFERWSDVVRSSLVWLGCSDPVNTIAAARSEDSDRENFSALHEAWTATVGSAVVSCIGLVTLAEEKHSSPPFNPVRPVLRDILLAVAERKGAINTRQLGNWLYQHRDTVLNGHVFRKAGARLWQAL